MTMFFLLAVVIATLIYRLTVKDRYMKKGNPQYNKEIRTLYITLVVFGFSYLLRWLWNTGYLQ